MDGGDLWNSRLSSSSSSSSLSRRYQLRSEALLGDDFIVEDEYKQEFSCPFCAEEFDIVGLVCHIDEEHQVEVKHGLCPICAKKVGVEMVDHVQRRRRLRRNVPNSMFNILRKELREGNRQSLFGGSSFVLSSSNPVSDPLLSSFIYKSPSTDNLGKEERHSSTEASSLQSVEKKSSVKSGRQPSLSKEDHDKKSNKSNFVRGLLLSTILDDV
ncbi:hypothetical protein Cgig2_029147 [Carnegiea gigantea]|uniref:Uncharacterized protein n=1 Tax=Carnegiea gigantea TaxID=171969 RepID=A0A9Q1KKC5_9CARY|nr:hypothetical protein Cgig2_029147 [Carnegiea gigantea]